MRHAPILLVLALAGCALPSRQSFAPSPVGADTQTIAATQAFAGRYALITILPGTADFAGPVAQAVHAARRIKPAVRFEVQALSPQAATPDASAANLRALSSTASGVARAIVADGVPADRVSLTAKTAGLDATINVYVK